MLEMRGNAVVSTPVRGLRVNLPPRSPDSEVVEVTFVDDDADAFTLPLTTEAVREVEAKFHSGARLVICIAEDAP